MKRRRVELLDTSILLELLQVPFESDHRETVLRGFEERQAGGTELHLPIAAVVEAGDHVGRVDNGHERRLCAQRLERLIRATLDREVPWSFDPVAWDVDLLGGLLDAAAGTGLSLVDSLSSQLLQMGDLLIFAEFQRLRANLDQRVVEVDVWTLDANLRAAVDAQLAPRRPLRRRRPGPASPD